MPARTPTPFQPAADGLLSIGALSAATGVPVETIRTWERRYGFPVAERKPSGHRVYPLTTVPRLRLIAQALTRGHRAAEVVPAPESVLESLLAAVPPAPARPGRPPSPPSTPADSADLLDAVRAFDAERLKRILQAEWARLGPMEFLERRAAPFLAAVGNGWASGALDIRHEHFASACLGDFLRAVRMPLDDRATGPVAALTTLPGELHGLGLQMSALVFALAGWRVLLLGVDTPVDQVAALAREAPIAAVGLSGAEPGGREAAEALEALRRRLPRRIPLLVGGTGAPPLSGQAGIEVLESLTALERWIRARPAG